MEIFSLLSLSIWPRQAQCCQCQEYKYFPKYYFKYLFNTHQNSNPEIQLLSHTHPTFKPAEPDEPNAVNFKILKGLSSQANVNSVLGLLRQ